MNKLENFSSVYYMTLEESVDRQKNIQTQFQKYDINPIPIVSKRYSESLDIIKSNYLELMDPGTIGCAVSHLKAIKKWYEETDENYAFFCEDDLSLETVNYWNFTWEEFIESVPEDADCVQLLRLREDGNFSDLGFRKREWNDWSVTAYIITREYASKIISEHCVNDEYHLDIKGQDCMPLVEYIIFNYGITYSVPLFVEDTNFKSTFSKSLDHNQELHASTHLTSYEVVLNWWKNAGKNLSIKDLFVLRSANKKIVDYFPFFAPTGREMLKLRLNMLKDYVDEFIICESNKTQSGIPIQYELRKILKELNLTDYNIRIIDLNIPDDENLEIQDIDYHNCYDNNSLNLNSVRSRVRERMQKDALLSVIHEYSDDTVFIHSDIDEIISPSIIDYISSVSRQNLDSVIRVPLIHLEGRSDMRVYLKDSDEPKEWTGMFVTTKLHLTTATPTQIRSNVFNPFPIVFLTENGSILKDLGWHFSWMGNSDIRNIKCKSFTHHDDKFSYLTASKYSGNDMKEFQKKLKFEEGQIPPSGDKNMILKYYPVEKLPKEVFIFDDVREFLLPSESENETLQDPHQKTEIEKLLINYALNTENAENNFNLGFWYENQGHTAPAVSYYLRCAERSEDKDLSYESLIRASQCYSKQGTRDLSSKCLLQQALSLCPKRPESYFLLSLFSRVKSWWTDSYNFADMGLIFSDFNSKQLRTDVGYPGKYGLLYEKAVSGWWWGRVDETQNILIDIKNNYNIDLEYDKKINEFSKQIGVEI
jgi:GR25 family glycosyltransferase involved in LPS biosynthesis/tetratricopeptide (TPR) repeat protein